MGAPVVAGTPMPLLRRTVFGPIALRGTCPNSHPCGPWRLPPRARLSTRHPQAERIRHRTDLRDALGREVLQFPIHMGLAHSSGAERSPPAPPICRGLDLLSNYI